MPSPNSLATQRFALSASNATGASAWPESLSRSEAGKGAHVKPPASDLEFGLRVQHAMMSKGVLDKMYTNI